MTSKSPNITIVAYTITSHGGGLENFLTNAVYTLTRIKPSWNFNLIWYSSFAGSFKHIPSNLQFQNWDSRSYQRVGITFLNKVLPGFIRIQIAKMIMHRIDRIRDEVKKTPEAISKTLQNSDVLWVPFYNISFANLSLYRGLSEIQKPILFTIHDIHPVFYPVDWPAESLGRFWLEMVPFAQHCQHNLTISQFQRNSMIYHIQLEPDKIESVLTPNQLGPGVLMQSFSPQQVTSTLAGFGIRPPFVLYPGSTTNMHKNHTRLLIAWAELRNRLGSACPMLVCTAKGRHWPELKSLIEALQLRDKVVFTDTIDTARLALLIQNSALVVVPTLYEGSGSGPVTDACLAGKPVVCSQIPPIEEHLNYLGYEQPQFFDPLSVLSIVQAVQEALQRLPQLEEKARTNQQRVLARLPSLWSEWSDHYVRGFEHIVAQA